VKKFLSILLFALLLFASLFTPGCSSGSNVGDVVCDYGNVLCDVSTTICEDIPGVPSEVCNYLDLACYNLQTICDLRDSTETTAFKSAVLNIQLATEKLRAWKLAQSD
jgi:hypothetical protein